MSEKIIAAILGGLVTVLATWIGRLPVENWLSSRMRHQNSIPEIMGTKWSAEWRYEDGSLYARDTVTFSKWTENNEFEGFGEVTHQGKEYKYSITGEVSRTGIVVLTYKAERYPMQANIGTACLQLSVNAEGLEGTWAGLAATKQPDGKEVAMLRAGRVTMQKTKDLNP